MCLCCGPAPHKCGQSSTPSDTGGPTNIQRSSESLDLRHQVLPLIWLLLPMLFSVPAGERKKMCVCVLSKRDFCLRHTGWGRGGLSMCPGALAGESKEARTPHPASLGMILCISNAILGNSFIWLARGGENQEGGRLSLTSAGAGWSSFLTTTAVICPSPSPHGLGDAPPWGCRTAEAHHHRGQPDTGSGAAHSPKSCRCSYSLFWAVLKDTTK